MVELGWRPVLLVALACVLTVCATAPALARGPLIALGDSYSSGDGVTPFEPGTATHTDTCHRSPFAFPVLVAQATARPVLSFACSGAVVDDVLLSDPGRHEPERRVAQIRRLPGQSPELVTLTIGGNDVHFADVLENCVTHSDCRKTYVHDGTDRIDAAIARLELRLPMAYRQVAAAAPGAHVVVVGYPRIFKPKRSLVDCALGLSRAETTYLNAKAAHLDAAIEGAARAAGVAFVDVTTAFAGHEVSCIGAGSWVRGATAPIVFSFHPNRRGQAALADAVERRLKTLGLD